MSRSKNKIAVTTLLSALACSATTTSAAGPNEKDIKSVESQTTFSTRKSPERSIESARSLSAASGATSWLKKIPTWAKITALVSTPIVAAEIYNEIAGAVSGKEWYSGKYSFVNLARGKGKDETKKPDENNDPDENLKLGPNSNLNLNPNPDLALDMNIKDDKDKKYTNSGDTNRINKKDNTGLGAAPCIGEDVVKKLKKGVENSKKEKKLFPYKYNNVDVNSEVSTIIMLLNSVAKSEVVNGNGYENLKSLSENNNKNFKGLTVDIYDELEKELCYMLKFKIDENWIGYIMRKVNNNVGMVQKAKWNGNKWEVDGEILNFNLKK